MTRVSTLIAVTLLLALPAVHGAEILRAVAKVKNSAVSEFTVTGKVTFVARPDTALIGEDPQRYADAQLVDVDYDIRGFPGVHGFHVHEFGDLRRPMGDFIGEHFIYPCTPGDETTIPGEPTQCFRDGQHGRPTSDTRHPGDMGNIDGGTDRVAVNAMTLGNNKLSLTDPVKSIVGRSLAVHLEEDVYLQPYGRAGGIEATGVIGLSNPGSGNTNPGLAPNNPRPTKAIAVFLEQQSAVLLLEAPEDGDYMDVTFTHPDAPAGKYTLEQRTWGDITDGVSLGATYGQHPKLLEFDHEGGLITRSSASKDFDPLRQSLGRAIVLKRDGQTIDTAVLGVPQPTVKAGEIVIAAQEQSAAPRASPAILAAVVAALLALLM
eukprot:PLAT11311.1.p1 GENE.PLAT11311.1~~PLAT11311.1.p1  ORF type:complete len:377 (+),score=143.01 PLAT11311.1:22-1152(+)